MSKEKERRDLLKKTNLILHSVNKRNIEDAITIQQFLQEDLFIPDSASSLVRLHKSLESHHRKPSKRLIIILAVIAVTLITSGITFAYHTGIFARFFGANSIKVGVETKEFVPDSKSYSSVEEAVRDLKQPIPAITELPEGISINNIQVKKIDNFFEVNILYGTSDDIAKIRFTCKYYADGSKKTSEIDVNPTYDKLHLPNFNTDVTLYSDMERRIGMFEVDNFYIVIESKYSVEETKNIIQSINYVNY